MKLLPIVPGCVALTYNCSLPGNNNKVVKVVASTNDAPVPGFSRPAPYWVTDTDSILIGKESGTIYGSSKIWSDCNLLRIDGGDFSHERETEKVREKA